MSSSGVGAKPPFALGPSRKGTTSVVPLQDFPVIFGGFSPERLRHRITVNPGSASLTQVLNINI
ncbi:MAG: hypothetical protein M1423_05530 [Acidobacteria bacterium]|nr:hypothetical protein [Acidobacteriota bacterium]